MSDQHSTSRAPFRPDHAGASIATGDPHTGLYGRAVRRYWWIVLLFGVVAAGIGLLAVMAKEDWYSATAEIGLRPLPQYDETFVGVDVIRQIGDVTQSTETVAAIFEGPEFAAAAAQRLDPPAEPAALGRAVTVTPFGQSSILRITATDADPVRAQQTANAYSEGVLELRRTRFMDTIRDRIAFLQRRKRALPADDYGGQNDAGSKLNTLSAVQSSGIDPTVFLASRAQPAQRNAAVPASRAVPLAGIVGLIFGSAAALALALASRAVHSSKEAVALSGLPVLARLPARRRRRRGPVVPVRPGSEGWESHRAVAAQVARHRGSNVFAVVSASRGDGRTSVAAGLALALADMGASVILVDLDLANPQLSAAVGGVADRGSVELADGLSGTLAVSSTAPRVRVLAANVDDALSGEALLRRLGTIFTDLRSMADFVIVDTAPYIEVSDVLRVAPSVDDVIVVTQTGTTDRDALGDLLTGLEQTGASSIGMVVVDGAGARRGVAVPPARPAPKLAERPPLSPAR